MTTIVRLGHKMTCGILLGAAVIALFSAFVSAAVLGVIAKGGAIILWNLHKL